MEDGFTVVDLTVKVLHIEESIDRTTDGIVGINAVEDEEANEAVGEKIDSELDDTHNTISSQNIIFVL